MMRAVARVARVALGLALLDLAAAAKLDIYEAAANAALDQPPLHGGRLPGEGPGGALQKPAAAEADKTRIGKELKVPPPSPPVLTSEHKEGASAAQATGEGSKTNVEGAKAKAEMRASAEATDGECTEGAKEGKKSRSEPADTQLSHADSQTSETAEVAVLRAENSRLVDELVAAKEAQRRSEQQLQSARAEPQLKDSASAGEEGDAAVEPEDDSDAPAYGDMSGEEKNLPEGGASLAEFGSSGEASVESDARSGAEADLDSDFEDTAGTEKPTEVPDKNQDEDKKEATTRTGTTTGGKSGSRRFSVAWLLPAAAAAFATVCSA